MLDAPAKLKTFDLNLDYLTLLKTFDFYLDAPTPVKDTTANDLFSDFLSSTDPQPSSSNYGGQFGAMPHAAVTSGAQDVGLLEATEQKKATKDAIMALYGTSSVGKTC